MGELLEELQYRLKTSSTSIALIAFKITSGLFMGLVIALVFEEILRYGTLSFVFVVVAVTMAFYRLARPLQFVGVAVFDLVCVLLALLLRMYILIAPGG